METEKTSYTLNHNGEELEDKKNESYEPIEEDVAVETDKMLLKNLPMVEKPTEVSTEADERTALANTEAVEEKQISNPPTKNRFLQFFERKQPKIEQNESQNGTQNGNGNVTDIDGAMPAAAETAPKRRLLPLKLQNPFAKKTEVPTPVSADKPIEASSSDEKKAENRNEKKNETKFPRLASIRLPFSGILNKFRTGGRSDDIELGNSASRGKAGLASMETLDDSTKDPWNQENAPDVLDSDKPDEPPKKDEGEDEKKLSAIVSEIRNYNCSLDDIALIGGILLFLLLVSLILAFTFLGNTKQTIVAPIRDGKVLAVTSCGPIEGLVEDSAVAFRGIPYAKPPLGNLRFEYAEVIDDIEYCWNGTLKAHNSTSECLQVSNGEIQGAEDCLKLDIITPEVRYINLLPVVVMIGANDFMGGSPGILRPSARYARSKDVIFVRPRFRLNVLGFLALETLSNSSNIPSSGNYALSDIIAALEWVQINIRHFGGDPSSVTLFGHRTGATLVTALTSSSKANKLFARVWLSSPSAHFPGKPLIENERDNINYANSFPGCDDKACWKKTDSKLLLEKVPKEWTHDFSTTLPGVDENKSQTHEFLVLDGTILKKHPENVWKTDLKLATKMVIGTTAHVAYDKLKGSEFSNFTAEDVRKYVNDSKIGQSGLTEEALEIYGETVQGLIAMISDIRYVCPLLVLSRSQDNLPFYLVTQTQGALKLADVDSDVQAIMGRYSSETPEKRRYLDAIRQLFYYYVGHGKVLHYRHQNFILNIEQDVIPQSDLPNCDIWIKHNIVPHYAAVF